MFEGQFGSLGSYLYSNGIEMMKHLRRKLPRRHHALRWAAGELTGYACATVICLLIMTFFGLLGVSITVALSIILSVVAMTTFHLHVLRVARELRLPLPLDPLRRSLCKECSPPVDVMKMFLDEGIYGSGGQPGHPPKKPRDD